MNGKKIYKCDLCNYETTFHGTWYNHKNSKKHKLLIEQQEINDNEMNNKKIIKSKTDKLKKDHEIELLKQKIKYLENEKKIFSKQLESNKEQLESTKEQFENHIETLRLENKFQKELINSAGGMIQKSMNTMSYLLTNYNDAPCLSQLNDYSVMSKSIDYFIKDLIFYMKKNMLDKYIGDFIVKQYKKDDPKLQAMWSSDTDRLNYFIREFINNKDLVIMEDKKTKKNQKSTKINQLHWISDKKGIKMANHVINPLLNYICNINAQYLLQKAKDNELLDLDKVRNNLEDMQIIASINSEIKNNNLSKNINKYIAPHFYFDKTICMIE